MGIWSLGLDYLGLGGNGHYGLDVLEFQGAVGGDGFAMDSTLIAALNTTNYFLGYFGLGITQANFDGVVAKSPLTDAVETYGLIPSYTYGYTAGAHYRNTPASLVLGGYDSARFANDHDNQFTLGSDDNFPWTLVRGVQAKTRGKTDITADWDSNPLSLMNYSDSFTAQIDSTTPFLWLPEGICDAFASALNLTYNSTFDLYLLTDGQYESFGAADAYEFVFSLSSFDNTDNFGDPLSVPGVVNITIPSRALVGTLKYPYMEEAIGYGDPAVPYFALRKSNQSLIIGRSFLQETYLLTQYDKRTYSIHQAQFPDASSTDITTVEQPYGSPYPPPKQTSKGKTLSAGVIGGVVAGSVIGAILAVVAFWMCRRKRKAKQSQGSASDSDLEKRDSCSSKLETQAKGSTMTRFVNRIFDRKKGADVKKGGPSEVPNHEIFELPCPEHPIELNGDGHDADNEGEYGYDTRNLSAYEQARLKIDRQLAGPVPEYSPPASGQMPAPEKEQSNNIQRPAATDSPQYAPVSPPAPDSNYSNSLNGSALSPISPQSATYPFTRAATVGPHSTRSTWGRSTGSNQTNSNSATSPVTPSRIALPPSPRFQRTPIDPSNVVYLGLLPDQEHQTSRPPTPEILHPDGRPVNTLGSLDTDGASFNSSIAGEDEIRWHMHLLEEARLAALRDAQGDTDVASSTMDSHRRWSLQTEHFERSHDSPAGTTNPGTHSGREYLDLAAGMEFVHVPQLAHRRYSWEEEE